MKLDGWVEKIIANVMDRISSPINQRQVLKENLKALVQDIEVVRIGITKNNQVYVEFYCSE